MAALSKADGRQAFVSLPCVRSQISPLTSLHTFPLDPSRSAPRPPDGNSWMRDEPHPAARPRTVPGKRKRGANIL